MRSALASYGSSVLAASDPWALPASMRALKNMETIGFIGFSQAVLSGDCEKAWDVLRDTASVNEALSRTPVSHCSKFLRSMPSGSYTAQKWFPRALQFRRHMLGSGNALSSGDYAALINIAFKSRQPSQDIERIWQNMVTERVPRDTNAWNQYIMAMCDAYPPFWPKHVRKGAGHLAPSNTPARTIRRPLEVLTMMEIERVAGNARTYELIMLAAARQRDLPLADKILEMCWLSKVQPADSPLAPSLSTLTAVINAWAFNSACVEGLERVHELQKKYSLPLGSKDAESFWHSLLRWVRIQTEPSGNVPSRLFESLWEALREVRGSNISPGMWAIRTEFLISRNQFDILSKDIPDILGSDPHPAAIATARVALNKLVKGYANTGRGLDAVSLLEYWAPRGLDLRPELEGYVQKRGATREQLEMFREDDDEDSLF